MKICHMTSAHSSNDIRIFVKECVSLAEAGHEVYLVAPGENREDSGVHIIGVGMRPKSRKKRMLKFTRIVYKKAVELDCDVYHFHDPELIPYGLKLKKVGKKVIFDSHEDVSAQIKDKSWLPNYVRIIVSKVYYAYETYAVKNFDAVVAATPHIGETFNNRAKKVVVVNNYPKLDDIKFTSTPFEKRENIICYAGGISKLRGLEVMVEAVKDLDVTLVLAGPCDEPERLNNILGRSGGRVKYLGVIDRCTVVDLYSKSVMGLCLLFPACNYLESLPIKMFEYMAAGIPFVCSDFPLWKQLVEETGAGFYVNIENINDIKNVIKKTVSDKKTAQLMGQMGREKVEEKYNWKNESLKLCKLYSEKL